MRNVGRKFWAFVIGLVALAVGVVAYCKCPAFAPGFSTYVGGVVGLCAVYHGGNVGDTLANRKPQ